MSTITTETEQLTSIYASSYPAQEVIWNFITKKDADKIETEVIYASKVLQSYKERYGDNVHLHTAGEGYNLHKGRVCQLKKELPNGDLVMDETILATKDYNEYFVYSHEVFYSKEGIRDRHL